MLQPYNTIDDRWIEDKLSLLQTNLRAHSSLRRSKDDESLWLFANVGSSLAWENSHFSSPKRYVWIPNWIDDFDSSSQIKEIARQMGNSIVNLVIRIGEGWFYVNKVTIGAVIYREYLSAEIEFTLEEGLPRTVWQLLGGYTGWLVLIDDKKVMNIITEDEINIWVETLANTGDCRIRVTRFEDDVFLVYLFGPEGVIVYQKEPRNSYVSISADQYGPPRTIEFRYQKDELNYEFSNRCVLRRERAIQMLGSFLKTGEPMGLTMFEPH